MRLVPAEGPLLDRILDHTYPVWNEKLSPAAYGRWYHAQRRTPWGGDRLHRFALVDTDGQILSSAKRYRFDARLGDREVTMAGLGAVFTPPAQRGRGHARALIEQIAEEERRAGTAFLALFSEIGEAFYRDVGFTRVPMEEVTVQVIARGGAPAMLVRAGGDADLPAIAAMHDVRAAGTHFSLRRDVPLVQYAIAKKRLQAGLGPPGLRQTEFFVVEEGASAVAYVVLTATAGGWTIEEAGDRDPAAARFGALLQVLLAREPSHRPPLIRTWWPPAFPVPPQLRLVDPVPARDLLMLRPLADLVLPARAADVFYWRSDYF